MPRISRSEYVMQDQVWETRAYLILATVLLLVAAFFRIWHLGTTPPGMTADEILNAQLAGRMGQGQIAVIYDQIAPAREGLYYVYLALATTLLGKGIILYRLTSAWLSMLSLAVTLALMRRLFGGRIALMAMGLMAVTFWPVWMGRAVLHVTLMPLVTGLVAYFFMRAFQASEEEGEAGLWFTVGGIALGLSQYVHITAWTLYILYVVFVTYRWLADRREFRRHAGNIIYALLLSGIINLPLIIFLANHPGAREPVPLAQQPRLLAEIPGRLLSSLTALALRGDMLPEHNLPGRPVMSPIIALLMITGIGVAFGRWRRPAYGLTLLWLAVGLLPTAFLPRKPDFEFMAVILPVVFVFPAMGLRALYEALEQRLTNGWQRLTGAAVSLLVTALIAATAYLTYRDYFLAWPTKGDVRLAYLADVGVLAHYLDATASLPPVSICSTPVDRAADPFALSNQELLAFLMHRRHLPIRYFDCSQSLVLANGGEMQLIIFPREHYYDRLPGPLLAWMRFAEDEHIPGIRPDVVMRLDAAEAIADRLGVFITTAPTAWPPESGQAALTALPVAFEYNVTFLGYDVRDDLLQPTDWIELTTYWRLDGPPPPSDVVMFAHLLGNPVVVIAQVDSLGVPVATLQPRDIFIQYSMIQTPGGMAPGLYPLSVGLYFKATGERLTIYEQGVERASRLFLQRIEVRH